MSVHKNKLNIYAVIFEIMYIHDYFNFIQAEKARGEDTFAGQ